MMSNGKRLTRAKAGRVGRPAVDNREVLEGILWILRSGVRLKDLPKRYPSAFRCWRRLCCWEEEGLWLKVCRKFLGDLDVQCLLNWEEAFIDGSFAPAKKGALGSEKPKGAKDRSGWWWSTARVFLWQAPLPRYPRTK